MSVETFEPAPIFDVTSNHFIDGKIVILTHLLPDLNIGDRVVFVDESGEQLPAVFDKKFDVWSYFKY